MPATFDLTMPSSSPLQSRPPHLVLDLPHSLLMTLDKVPSQGEQDNAQNVTCPDVVTAPRLASTRIGMATGTTVHRPAPVDSDHTQPSPLSYALPTVPSTSQTSPIGRASPIDDAIIGDRPPQYPGT